MYGFPYWGDGGEFPSLAESLFIPLHQKKSPSRDPITLIPLTPKINTLRWLINAGVKVKRGVGDFVKFNKRGEVG